MKKLFLVFSTLLSSALLVAQENFKKGYYITNSGVKTEGFIKSSDFRLINESSLKNIEFKKSIEQEPVKIDKSIITAFGSENDVKIQKIKVLLDDVNLYKDYDNERGFSFQEKTVFLNVLVEGKATLYSYDGGQGVKYLWRKIGEDEVAKQLLYKRYYLTQMLLGTNNTFREQLFNDIKCPNQKINEFLKVKYEKDELIEIFANYNKCTEGPFKIYKNENAEKALLKFSVLAGYSLGTFYAENLRISTKPETYDIFSVGLENELIFASRKGSVFASFEIKKGNGSTEQTSKTSEFSTTFLRQVYTIDAYFLDVILGGRFYKKISANKTLFAGGGIGLNLGSGHALFQQANTIDNELQILNRYKLGGSGFFSIHIGCQLGKNWATDINFDSPKNIVNNVVGTSGSVYEFGLNMRYKF